MTKQIESLKELLTASPGELQELQSNRVTLTLELITAEEFVLSALTSPDIEYLEDEGSTSTLHNIFSLLQTFRWWFAGGIGATCFLAVLLPLNVDKRVKTPTKSPSLKIGQRKGGPVKSEKPAVSLMYKRTGEKNSFLAKPGEILHSGDLVQFLFRLSEDAHAMVVGLNRRGKVEPYFLNPKNQRSVFSKAGKGKWPSNEALELDDSLGPELFIVIVRTRPFSYSSLKKEIEAIYQKAGRDFKKVNPYLSQLGFVTIPIEKREKAHNKRPKP